MVLPVSNSTQKQLFRWLVAASMGGAVPIGYFSHPDGCFSWWSGTALEGKFGPSKAFRWAKLSAFWCGPTLFIRCAHFVQVCSKWPETTVGPCHRACLSRTTEWLIEVLNVWNPYKHFSFFFWLPFGPVYVHPPILVSDLAGITASLVDPSLHRNLCWELPSLLFPMTN